jgi:hypothetical protein
MTALPVIMIPAQPRGSVRLPAPECPQRDSNPRYGLERAATWTASRWGPGAASLAVEGGDTMASRAGSSAGRAADF